MCISYSGIGKVGSCIASSSLSEYGLNLCLSDSLSASGDSPPLMVIQNRPLIRIAPFDSPHWTHISFITYSTKLKLLHSHSCTIDILLLGRLSQSDPVLLRLSSFSSSVGLVKLRVSVTLTFGSSFAYII